MARLAEPAPDLSSDKPPTRQKAQGCSDHRTTNIPEWLNIDAVVLSTHRDAMPSCVAAASDLVAAVLAFGDVWAPHLIDVEERAHGVLGGALSDRAWEILKTVGIFDVSERIGLAPR